MYKLGSFGLVDKLAIATAVRRIAADATSARDAAERVVRLVFESLAGDDGVTPACALVRLYLTAPYASLDAEERQFARGLCDVEPSASTRCLRLVGSAGVLEDWNHPERSVDHRAIPLISEEMVRSFPMIAQLFVELGLDIQQVVSSEPRLLVDEDVDYNVFYVPVAVGSGAIPAQQDFVVPYRIESVIGCGGVLPSGDVFALILFSRVHVPLASARLFKTFALSLKSAILSGLLAEQQRHYGSK